MKVLVVDDNPANRELVGKTLADRGYEVEMVGDGQEAQGLLIAGMWFDAFVSDMNMPIMTGLELLQYVRASERHSDAVFVLMSALDMISDTDRTELREICETFGAKFLKKPFSTTDLIKALTRK